MAMRSKGATGIRAVIGPCIKQKSYEVGADMRDAVLARDPVHARFFVPGQTAGKWRFDLAGYCAARLERVEIPAECLPNDTCAEARKVLLATAAARWPGEAVLGHQISAIRTL